MKSFGKPLINLTIFSGFLKPVYVLEKGFQYSFLISAAASHHNFLANQNIQKPWKTPNKNFTKL
jgi:hypothetical protein